MLRTGLVASLFLLAAQPSLAQDNHTSQQHDFKLVEVTNGLDHPWGMAFLPDGRILITERDGPALRLVEGGVLHPSPIAGLPDNISTPGQGGLLDITLHPNFATNQVLYLSYAGKGDGGVGTEVLRARLVGHHLKDVETVFQVFPKTGGSAHYGSRLQFGAEGELYVTVGDRYNYMNEAQNPANHLGSILRLTDEGKAFKDNPFSDTVGKKPEIYTFGHRNPQGLTVRHTDGSLWAHEHGPRGGDEVNKLKAGANYGWPAITYGIDYSGRTISDKTHAAGMEQPVVYWDPSIAPSGMAFYKGDKFPNWQDDLFVGALAGQHLRRLEMEGDQVVDQEVLLDELARIRDVRNAPDGYLYILTDESDGKLYRLEPSVQ
jgi:glucose/arabinose dehydrogenase